MRVNGLTPQDLKAYGIHDVQEVVYNPDYDTLYQEEAQSGTGRIRARCVDEPGCYRRRYGYFYRSFA